MNLTVYLSGEIHSDWREQIMTGIQSADLPVKVLSPVTDHPASDNVGVNILGAEELAEWKDHKAAKINRMRILLAIEQAEIVVVKFGDQYKQWNAAFEAGYAVAKGKMVFFTRFSLCKCCFTEACAYGGRLSRGPENNLCKFYKCSWESVTRTSFSDYRSI